MQTFRRWIALLGLVFMAGFPVAAQAAPENGWWWNPSESGRGFFIEIQDTLVYLGGYFYANDGRALWLVSQGNTSSPTTYSGRLLSFANGQTLVGDYRPPGAAVDIGAIDLVFTDDRHATLTWPGGTIPLERQIFDPTVAEFLPQTGWWWNDAESGRGYSVEIQGNNLFFVGFMYDAAGNPLWYFSAGPLTTPSLYTGQLLQFANGQTLTGSYRPPGTPAVIGSMSLDFTAPDAAELTFTDPSLAPLLADQFKAGRSKLINVKPQFRPRPTAPPAKWVGKFKQVTHFRVVDVATVDSRVELVGTATWAEDYVLGGATSYKILGGVDLFYTYSLRSSLQNCDGTHFESFALKESDGNLVVKPDGSYTGSITGSLSYTPTGTCVQQTPQGGTITFPLTGTNVADLDIQLSGNVVNRRIQGRPKPFTPTATTVTKSWDFSAR